MKVNTIKGEIVCPFCGEANPSIKGDYEKTFCVEFYLEKDGYEDVYSDTEVAVNDALCSMNCCCVDEIDIGEAIQILNGEYEVRDDDYRVEFDYDTLDDKIEIKRTRKKKVNPKKLLINKLK